MIIANWKLHIMFWTVVCIVCALAVTPAAVRPNAQIELESVGSGADTMYALRVRSADADRAVVTVFYHTRMNGFPALLLLSETEVVPLVDGATMAVGAFQWRGQFIDVAWVDVSVVKTVQKRKFSFTEAK